MAAGHREHGEANQRQAEDFHQVGRTQKHAVKVLRRRKECLDKSTRKVRAGCCYDILTTSRFGVDGRGVNDSRVTTGTSPEGVEAELTERYQVRTHLGSGGNGDAYLAWDTSLRREVVIKRLRTTGSDDTLRQHIMDEAAKMAATKHPNITAIYDITAMSGAPCIVMEHVQGLTIEARVQVGELCPPIEMVELARQCLEALVAAHAVGLIHRDLKPSNIMTTGLPSGAFQVKVLDFGMAKFVDPATPSPQTVAIDGSILGSIHFISPEQLNRDPVDARSDLYSLGCTLYYALTGVEPFGGDTVPEVITAHLTHRVRPARELCPALKPSLDGWLMRMIAHEAPQRFASAFHALEALREAARRDGIPVATTAIGLDRRSVSLPAAPPRPPRKLAPWLVGAALILLGLLGGVGAYFFTKTPSSVVEIAAAEPPLPEPPTVDPLASLPVAESTPDATPQMIETPAVLVPVSPPPAPEPSPTPVAVVAPPVAPAPVPVVLEVAGSNTIGAKLMPALLRAFLEQQGAGGFESRALRSEEQELSFQAADGKGRAAVVIRAHGSSTAFQALQDGSSEIGMASRPIKSGEAEKLAALGDMTSPVCEHVVGLDGLAVIVNRANGVESLTIQQLADLFSGAVSDWAEVGGQSGPVTIYARDDKSGTYDSFKAMVLGEKALRSDAKRFEDSGELSASVAADPSAIGFIGLPYVRTARALAIGDTGTQPMLPSAFTVGTEDYVLARRLFLYTPAAPRHEWTSAFIDFVQSDAGQKIVEATGFVPQAVAVEPIRTRPGLPPAYADVIARTSGRLSLSFRFLSGRAELDAKAVRDLERVVLFLARPENRNRQVYLLGFSDSSGSAPANVKLSQERAGSVARQLAMRGITGAQVLGFGQELPVAANTTKAGQDKNRRVEVWIE